LIAWSACDGTDRCALYLRPLDRVEATKIADTEDASWPAFSPDGRWIAFFADGKLKKIATSGGAASTLADAPSPGGVAWGSDGRIVFAGAPAGGLSIVDDEGGGVRAITTPRVERGELRHRNPAWLPRGDVLFTITASTAADAPGELAVAVPPHNAIAILRSGVTRAVPAGRTYLVLSTGTDLQAATFDESTLALTGRADSVLTEAGARGVAQFTVGANGTLTLIHAAAREPLVWADAPDRPAIAAASRVDDVAIAPDATHAAAVVRDGNGADIWTIDFASGALTRLTFGGTNISPAWSTDGQRLLYATRGPSTGFQLTSRRIDDRTAAPLPTATPAWPTSVAGDGRIAITTVKGGHTAIGIVPAAGGTAAILSDGPFDESAAAFSPDGRWLAFESDESGRGEIVARDTQNGRRIALPTHGGTHPRWSDDGRWIYYDAGRRLMRIAFHTDGNASTAGPEIVFDRAGARAIAVTPSGRVLVRQDAPPTTALVALQWLRELRDRLPPPTVIPR
jgi:serine/threonine-protein kinase